MRKNLAKEINKYVESRRDIWSPTTLSSTRSKLITLIPNFNVPYANYKRLVGAGYGRYSIKIYFIIASRFEEECFGTKLYSDFLKRQKAAFKNCYRDKTTIIKPADYERFLRMYVNTNPAMYNLLVLMGQAGLRISEALNASWEHFFTDEHSDEYLEVIGKGAKQRMVPFEKSRLQEINTKGKVVGTCAFRFFFKRDLAPFTPHDFRAHYATFIANHPELSIKDAAMLLGHADIKTTSRYVRSDLNRVAKVLKRK